MKKNKKEEKQKTDLNTEIRKTGIILIVLGFIHFILSGFLDPTWGFLLIIVGIISFFYRSRNMLLTFGILLILVGVLNIFSTTYEISIGWLVFGVIQIWWGIDIIRRFKKTKENPRYIVKEKKKKFIWNSLRVSSWTMIGVWALNLIFGIVDNDETFILAILWIISIIFTFVVSIIHLTKHKNKAFAILSLVLSSFLIIILFIGAGMELGGIQVMDENIPCYNLCLDVEGFESYYFGYDYYDETGELQSIDDMGLKLCQCYDVDEEIILEEYFDEQDILLSEMEMDTLIEDYYASISLEPTVGITSGTLEAGSSMYYPFYVSSPSYANIELLMDKDSTVYLFSEDEESKYWDDEPSEYIVGGKNIHFLSEPEVYLDSGKYYLYIIANLEESTEYSYSVTLE